jgi:hypothetical protein
VYAVSAAVMTAIAHAEQTENVVIDDPDETFQ